MTEERRWWIFTFGCGQEHAGFYVKFFGTYSEAREKMFEHFGDKWAFQYSEEQWNTIVERAAKFGYSIEKELGGIEEQ